MQITLSPQSQCQSFLRVEVPADTVVKTRKSVIASFSNQVKIPGFRPGKVPSSVVEKRFGDAIAEEINTRLTREAYGKALEENKDLQVLDFGNVDQVEYLADGSARFEVKLTLVPQFTLPEYKDIALTLPPQEATEEEIQQEVDNLLERFSDFQTVERPLAQGDIAVIDFESSLEGKPLVEALGRSVGVLDGRKDYWIKAQDDAFLPKFSEQILGMEATQEKAVTCQVGDDFPVDELHGKDLVFTVTLKEVKEQELPTLDENFLKEKLLLPEEKASEEGLRSLIAEEIERSKTQSNQERKIEQIIDILLEKTGDFELPEDIVESEAQNHADSLVNKGARAGLSDEEIASHEADIINQARQQAVRKLKAHFLLREIAVAEKIEVDSKELQARLEDLARREKKPVKTFIKEARRSGRITSVHSSMVLEKTMDKLSESAKVTYEQQPADSSSQ